VRGQVSSEQQAANGGTVAEVPADGEAFQMRVWDCIRKVWDYITKVWDCSPRYYAADPRNPWRKSQRSFGGFIGAGESAQASLPRRGRPARFFFPLRSTA